MFRSLVNACTRRLRGHRVRLVALARGSRIAWSTRLLIGKGAQVQVDGGVRIDRGGNILVGDGCQLRIGARTGIMQGLELAVETGGRLTIGSDVYIGAFGNLRCIGNLRLATE